MKNLKNSVLILLVFLTFICCKSKQQGSIKVNPVKNSLKQDVNIKDQIAKKKSIQGSEIIPIDSIFCDFNNDSFEDVLYAFKVGSYKAQTEIAFFVLINKELDEFSRVTFNSNLIPNDELIDHNLYFNCNENKVELIIEEESAHPVSYTVLKFNSCDHEVFLDEIVFIYRDYSISELEIPFLERRKRYNFKNHSVNELNLLSKDKSRFDYHEKLNLRDIKFMEYEEEFDLLYQNIFDAYEDKQYSIINSNDIREIIIFLLDPVPVYVKTYKRYNDIAYFLEQSGAYSEAVVILEKIIKKYPDRVVAYINLGDAYWGLNDTGRAIKAYEKYMDLMISNEKEDKIPRRVTDRVHAGR